MDRLVGVVRNYDWGSTDALARLRGLESTGGPEAELWFGAHPAAPSTFAADGRTVTATEAPVLAKFLAVGRPLSLQVHPDDRAAAEGHRAEVADGLTADDLRRCFPDPVGKPEAVVAVERFASLCGLRPSVDMLAVAEATGMSADVVDRLRAGDRQGAVAAVLAVDGASAVPQMVDAVRRLGPELVAHAAVEVVEGLAAAHPDDPAVLLAPLMHHLVLEAGDALYVATGMLHAHLSGLAMEVMAPSDSVVRAGLTTKHVDVGRAVDLLDADATPRVVRHRGRDQRYDLPTDAFTVRRLQGTGSVPDSDRPSVVVCAAGAATFGADGRTDLTFAAGEAAWIGTEDGPVEVQVDGTAYLVGPGQPVTSRS